MKTTREKKNRKTILFLCAGILALICAANAAVLSSCSHTEASDDAIGDAVPEEEIFVYDPIETALANHFYVPSFSDITKEQFAQVETLDVYLVTPPESDNIILMPIEYPAFSENPHNAVYVSINGGNVEHLMPCMLTKRLFEDSFLTQVSEGYEDKALAERCVKRLRAFYSVKDPADPELDASAVSNMLALFPITKETPVAMYDAFVNAREDQFLYIHLYEAGMVNEAAFSESALRAKLASIPALADAEIQIMTASSLADFDVDPNLFKNCGSSYRVNNPEYRIAMEEQKAQYEADTVKMENDFQIDINGNGVIGE
ncbi:MAG: hypothetical protein IJW77_17595 [Clostridia bacterium]|nr:hypothetical protein [Clostridia bacterium]